MRRACVQVRAGSPPEHTPLAAWLRGCGLHTALRDLPAFRQAWLGDGLRRWVAACMRACVCMHAACMHADRLFLMRSAIVQHTQQLTPDVTPCSWRAAARRGRFDRAAAALAPRLIALRPGMQRALLSAREKLSEVLAVCDGGGGGGGATRRQAVAQQGGEERGGYRLESLVTAQQVHYR